MARIRFTRQQAHAEASRRAEQFVAGLSNCANLRLRGCIPDSRVPQSRSSKHPLAWVAVFAMGSIEDCVIDGGELFITVDLESSAVAVREWI
jgi:hypothetical protein